MKVLTVCYGGGHATMVIPVVKKLLEKGIDVSSLALTTSIRNFEREGISYNKVIDYVNMRCPKILRYGEFLSSKHHTDGKGITIEDSIAYLGTSLNELVKSVGEDAALEEYEKKGLNAFNAVQFMERVIDIERPDIVVTTSSPRMEKAALQAAYKKGIPSICMVDLFALMEVEWLKNHNNGDVLAVFSEPVKNRLVSAGRLSSSVFVTGNPAFDVLADPLIHLNGKEYRKNKEISEDEFVVFWAEQPEPGNPNLPREIRALLSRICENLGITFIIRLHPSSTDITKEKLPDYALNSDFSESLQSVISASDLIITLTSTVAMEGLLLDKDVLILEMSAYSHLVDYSEDIGAMKLNDKQDIEKAIVSFIYDNKLKNKMKTKRKNLPTAGMATNKIVDLILKMGSVDDIK
ncbi:hypothetical protein PE36_06182 [Moritella sp. PE36]|uniref:UDP-N-acetylglucosamine 2-epimerase n=1 Tax=Moritella sp. PE36 TaxID=58051 RepID=UPI00015681C5|nr:UDP-N-acetylglucosamine 2-epimerase [Moritella sp. PE36]EDM69051.1 hypothetical protein PE36_06182 [Moritella sp. PE36]